MNTKFHARFGRALTILILTLALSVCAAAAFFCGNGNRAYAAEDADSSVILPYSPLEYLALSDPKGACYYGGNYAVIEGQKTVRILFESGTDLTLSGFTSLGQIKFYNDHSIFVSDNGSVYFIDLNSADRAKKLVTGGTFFDFNGEYLITVYSQILFVFRISDALDFAGGAVAELKSLDELANANGECPIAINEKNEIFYLSGRTDIKLNKYEISSKTDGEIVKNITATTPSIMIANENSIYFVASGDLYSLPAKEGAVPVKLNIPETPYDLGKVRAPEGLSFKNGNLLITDNNQKAVMEFTAEGDTLDYTGFAIASGRSAYNRIGKTTKAVGRYGNLVAALDDFKLTIINVGENAENFDRYDKSRFINLFVGNAPSRFALGNDTLLTTDGSGVFGYKGVSAIATADGETEKGDSEPIRVEGVERTVKAIAYQSGFYYVLATDGGVTSNNAYVYKINEKTFETEGVPAEFYGRADADKITVDVFGNVYIADGANFYKNSFNNAFPSLGATSLTTDLAGVLYGVIDGKVYYYRSAANSDGSWELAAELPQSRVKCVGAYFDKNEVYYSTEDGEYLYKTTGLKNLAVNSAFVPNDFLNRTALSYDEAKKLGQDELNYYVIDENASTSTTGAFGAGTRVNAYFANYSAGSGAPFKYEGLSQLEDEYIRVGTVELPSALGGILRLYVFAGRRGVVLVNSDHAKRIDKEKNAAPEKAYTSTNVNLYHLPVITEKDIFTATVGGKTLRLDKAIEIYPKSKTNFLGIEYYFATVTVGDTEYAGYIPSSFTVETLYENPNKDEYTVKTVSAVTVYANADLTDAACELADGTKVRYYGTEGGVAKIAYETADGYNIGYIEERKIRQDASVAVRNILITLAVVTSVCGTATYFILRKKKS